MYKRCSDKSQMFRICSPGAYEFSGTNRRSERVRENILQPSTANGLTRPKWSQLRFFSGVDLAPPFQPRRHVGYCSPRCPVAHGKLLTPGARWCPLRVPPPIACCAGTAELHGAGQGSATEALSRSGRETTSFHSNPGADGVLFRLVRRHPRAPGGASPKTKNQ